MAKTYNPGFLQTPVKMLASGGDTNEKALSDILTVVKQFETSAEGVVRNYQKAADQNKTKIDNTQASIAVGKNTLKEAAVLMKEVVTPSTEMGIQGKK